MYRRLIAVAVTAALAVPVSAEAIELNPFSMIKSAVEAIAEDRSSGDIATDLTIKTKITASVLDELGTDVISISSDVYEQDVMLTGSVETAKLKSQAFTNVPDNGSRWLEYDGSVSPVSCECFESDCQMSVAMLKKNIKGKVEAYSMPD